MSDRADQRRKYFESAPDFQTVIGKIEQLSVALDGSASLHIKNDDNGEVIYLEILNFPDNKLVSGPLVSLAVFAFSEKLSLAIGYSNKNENIVLMNIH
jgi:hypothetical protein